MSLDKSNIVIALHSLAPHGADQAVPVIGASHRIIGHARFDQKENHHVLRLPYDQWEKEGQGIIQFGTTPTTQWFPKVEAKDEAQTNPVQSSDAEKAGHVVEPTHAAPLDKLPEEVTPGHLTLPDNADTTHVPEEPPTPGEQRTQTDDSRIQMVQDVVLPAGEEDQRDRVLPTNAPGSDPSHAPDIVAGESAADAANVNEQPTPNEQRTATDDPRILAVQDVVVGSDENAPALGEPGSEKDEAKAELAAVAEDKKSDRNADLDAANGNFRKLWSIAKTEGVDGLDDHKTSADLRAAIELKRDEAAGK